jgi:hypothetical protein
MINALRTGNFLYHEGPAWLPVVYLVSVVATGLVVLLHAKIQVGKSVESLIVHSLAFFAFTGLLVHGALRAGIGAASGAINYV